ncbi:winged helix-turn-helix transcriptional regulator [Microbacterium gorillae]|uniref:winged helix-turn-helix transcriptional regulator n=1 Tax=Microbacterium gorillae TaxID=1231063 RepID=UPI0005905DEF|nr:helix-turn-helix domain-containing protein [Microbacterium gorillae]
MTLGTDAVPSPGPGCPIDCAMTALGSRASILLLRQAFYGDRRYDAFVEHTGISEATVAKRLQELVEIGVLRRVPYQESGSRLRHEYELTASGQELLPVILGLFLWGQRHLEHAEAGLRPIGPDGEPVQVAVQSATGRALGITDIQMDPVPVGN